MWNHNGKNWYSEEEYNAIKEELTALRQTYKACEKEYLKLAKKSTSNAVDEKTP